jgi:hypothetical protein
MMMEMGNITRVENEGGQFTVQSRQLSVGRWFDNLTMVVRQAH